MTITKRLLVSSIFFPGFVCAQSTSSFNELLCKTDIQQIAELKEVGITITSPEQLSEWQKQNCKSPKSALAQSSSYNIALSANLKNGSYKHNNYKFLAEREQKFAKQSRWDAGINYQLTELDDDELIIREEKLQAYSNITYQFQEMKKAISFIDVSYSTDDSSGLKAETNAVVGAGYAFWGADYHSKCNVAKYSLGVGGQQREMVKQEKLNERILSHKLSVAIGVSEEVCIQAKHAYRRILGFSELDKIINSLQLTVPINNNVSIFTKFLYTKDQSAATGFQVRDEQIEFGAHVSF